MSKWLKWNTLSEERKDAVMETLNHPSNSGSTSDNTVVMGTHKPRKTRAPIERRTQFGAMLRRERIARNLGQANLGKAIDVSGPTINAIERGKNMPSAETRLKIEAFFGKAFPDISMRRKPRRVLSRAQRMKMTEAARQARWAKKHANKSAKPAVGMDTSRQPENGRNMHQDLMALMFQYGVQKVAEHAALIARSPAGDVVEDIRSAVGKDTSHEKRR